MFASFGTTCTDGCDDEHELTEYELVYHNADDHHADTCSPFCGCSCCQTLSVSTPGLDLIGIDQYHLLVSGLYLSPPDPQVRAIWQPPKI